MFKKIYIPIDNSAYSNACMEIALTLAKATGGQIVGSHVYAARLHDMRFKQMEFTLPSEYQNDQALERQRQVHDSLIARGLHLISNSYLDVLEKRCKQANIPFERKTFDGKNYKELVKDIHNSDYDLIIMGHMVRDSLKRAN